MLLGGDRGQVFVNGVLVLDQGLLLPPPPHHRGKNSQEECYFLETEIRSHKSSFGEKQIIHKAA